MCSKAKMIERIGIVVKNYGKKGDLAKEMKVSGSTISHFLKGESLTPEALVKLADVSGESVDWILGRDYRILDGQYEKPGLYLQIPLVRESEVQTIKNFLKLFDVPEGCPIRGTLSEYVNVLLLMSSKVYKILHDKKTNK